MNRFSREFILKIIYSSPTHISDVFCRLQEVHDLFWGSLLIFIATTVLIKLWFFLFHLIVSDKFSSLQMLFHSFCFTLPFLFYNSAFWVFVCLRECSCPCMCIYFGRFFLSFIGIFPLIDQ